MNLLYIVIPFFFYSFSTKLITDSYKDKLNYDKILFVSLLVSCIICYIMEPNNPIIITTFGMGLILSYIQNNLSKKWARYSIEILVWLLIIASLYFTGFKFEKIAAIITFLSFIYFMLGRSSNNIPYIASQLVPVGLAGLYLVGSQATYPIIFMTLFGTIRFFIENKSTKESKLLTQSFTLAMFLLVTTFSAEEFVPNMSLLFAGFSFMILDYISIFVLRNKKSLIQRLQALNLFNVVAILKALALNLFGLIMFSFVLGEYFSIYIALGSVTIASLVLYLQIWYKENEYN